MCLWSVELFAVSRTEFTLGNLFPLAQSRRISKSSIADLFNNTHVLYCLYSASISYAGVSARENIIIIIMLILVFYFCYTGPLPPGSLHLNRGRQRLQQKEMAMRDLTSQRRKCCDESKAATHNSYHILTHC